jgi:hypothetical protein
MSQRWQCSAPIPLVGLITAIENTFSSSQFDASSCLYFCSYSKSRRGSTFAKHFAQQCPRKITFLYPKVAIKIGHATIPSEFSAQQ